MYPVKQSSGKTASFAFSVCADFIPFIICKVLNSVSPTDIVGVIAAAFINPSFILSSIFVFIGNHAGYKCEERWFCVLLGCGSSRTGRGVIGFLVILGILNGEF